MVKNIIIDFSLDLLGCTGVYLGFAAHTLEGVNELVKLVAGLGGLVLLGYSIKYKRMLIKQQKENKENETP
jgi:hypothetical protein